MAYLDINTRARWKVLRGFSACLRFGPLDPPDPDDPYCYRSPCWGFTLDVQSADDAPNRLHLMGRRYMAIIGLPGRERVFTETGRLGLAVIGEWKRGRLRIMRSQAWDWRADEWAGRWKVLAVHPADHRERWERAHPAQAAQNAARLRRRHMWAVFSADALPDRWYVCPGHIDHARARRVTCTACGPLKAAEVFDPGRWWLTPWTHAQIAVLGAGQNNPAGRPYFPYLCRGGLHDEREEPGPLLIPHLSGWRCPDSACPYTQNWAHATAVPG